MANDDERIALFLDYENLAIGARDGLGVSPFDFDPVADALAERGRVVVRRAYADWSYFDADRQLLAADQRIVEPRTGEAAKHAEGGKQNGVSVGHSGRPTASLRPLKHTSNFSQLAANQNRD